MQRCSVPWVAGATPTVVVGRAAVEVTIFATPLSGKQGPQPSHPPLITLMHPCFVKQNICYKFDNAYCLKFI